MAAHGITVYAVGCEPALGSYRFARDFMCTLAETTGGQAVALSSAKNLADVIINGSAEEISLTHLSREVEEEIQRVREQEGSDQDEDEVIEKAAMNLQKRSVKSKHMRHDGAMTNAAPEVWAGATSLKSAKAALCSAIDSPRSDSSALSGEECEEVYKKASLSSSSRHFKSKRAKKEKAEKKSMAMIGKAEKKPRSFMSLFFGAAEAADESDKVSSRASSESGDRETVRAAPVSRGRSAKSPIRKTLGTNVLEEDAISLDQVKRIAKRSKMKAAA
jgi:hypothetical protein